MYDVENPPDREAWLAMDEAARVDAVILAHERTRSAVGQSPAAHATIHVTVENRLVHGHVAVVAAYDRFRAAGHDRHTTIHALASVVATHMLAIVEEHEGFDQETADADFDRLDPAKWKRR